MQLTSTQIGAIGENILINAVMIASKGRLSAFSPVADDDGIDVLFFDKETGNTVAIQLKCRTVTIHKRGSRDRSNVVHFDVRKATFKATRKTYLVAALIDEHLSNLRCTWFIPAAKIPNLANSKSRVYSIRANISEKSHDKYSDYRCGNVEVLAKEIVNVSHK